jgi:hypothetical protein
MKIIAAVLCITFSLTSIPSYAQSIHLAPVQNLESEIHLKNPLLHLELPSELGAVTQSHASSPSTIIHIQDAHGQLDAQRKMEQILEHLRERYGVKTVLIEGGFNGLISPGLLRFYSDKRLNDRLAEHLLKAGRLGGSGLFLLHAPEDVKIFGVEMPELYRKNLFEFREFYARKSEAD